MALFQQVAVTRVRLHDAKWRHYEHWETTVLPRVYQWVEAVYTVRQDDRCQK
jgi:hypothetical protein